MNYKMYTWANRRIKELQNPELYPLGLALQYELDLLMSQVQEYEDAHDQLVVQEYDIQQEA